MILPPNFVVKSFIVNKSEFTKKETVHVPGRTFHGLTFRCSGKISILPEDSKKLVSVENSITFIPKGCSYDTEILEDGDMFAIHFETDDEFEDAGPFVFEPTYPKAFANLFESLVSRYRSFGKGDYSAFSILYEILSELYYDMMRKENVAVPKRMRVVKEYIDMNFYDGRISVSALAGSIGVSEVYFRKEFKKSFGATPTDYIKKVRIDNAKALLSTAMYSVSRVAAMCGFDSISYFSYEFKRITGQTPGGYMKQFEK